jgi:hypothetical protein
MKHFTLSRMTIQFAALILLGLASVVHALPNPGMVIDPERTALVITDPQNDFEVAVVTDATAAAIVPEGDGYQAALVNFRFIANTVWTTLEAVQAITQTDK